MGRNLHIKSQEKSKKPIKNGFIRLISGKWRGKKLPVKDKEGLRPTTDRTKETLFNWLMHDIRDANCLDCFSGSGSLAFEALSRFAKQAILLERDKQVAQQLRNNLKSLDVDNASVIEIDSLNYLQQIAGEQFDIVFIDPPFSKGLVQPCCSALEKNGYLAPKALIYIEREVQLSDLELPINWQLLKEKTTGQVSYQLYLRDE
ncbi:16S rRNA (guanine(966)-N(2))-methyltransferase RsmD [Psychromonas antarctica]|jgi:16S rRNA (guanine966-N2)-methyltransferase|uniref:16S rRNA (guanine(966)-N(2))-methyltransferase RsmD n=1 Tax=Psychromonas antarctica TaxID=67573 RepID=UPI001EE7C418|nr:16S rRNA (guanine(966)-N(2))-methyltransferase RsmD [Psychromonas antarctica]MCG6200154.1 16S rRNA (guanine(966)-N(2))-methyltransferase RsmD [Psychromonas antarctica]